MRLLNANTLEMKEYCGQIPPYAILSHTWGDEEVTFQDFQSRDRETKKGFNKIIGCCRQAQRDSIEWVWIDTCCIDKTSSAELSEAINSMYAWYRDSQVCYVFLEDVSAVYLEQINRELASARWFTRGWCLQELIAPLRIEFYARDWVEIGTKYSLRYQIQHVTKIPLDVLAYRNLEGHSVAEKMSWASERNTTRIEDQAYCLLGIFGVHMPLLYGEGHAAFHRLQEEIIKHTEDYSIFLWTYMHEHGRGNYDMDVLASSPRRFRSQRIELLDTLGDGVEFGSYNDITLGTLPGQPGPKSDLWEPPRMTSRGLHVCMPVTGTTSIKNHRITVWRAEPAPFQFLWTRCVYQDRLVGILLGEDTTAGGVKIYTRSRYGIAQLYLLRHKDALFWTRLRSSQSGIYLRTLSSDWGWDSRDLSYPVYSAVSPELELILLPSTENRITLLKAGNQTEDLSFVAETITEGPRKGETRLRATGITKVLATGLPDSTGIQLPNDSLTKNLAMSLQRLEMLVIVDQIPIWQGPGASNPLAITLLVNKQPGIHPHPKLSDHVPECNLCFTVSQQGFKNWNGTSDRDQLILPNGLILTAAVKSYSPSPTKPVRFSIHIGLLRPGLRT